MDDSWAQLILSELHALFHAFISENTGSPVNYFSSEFLELDKELKFLDLYLAHDAI